MCVENEYIKVSNSWQYISECGITDTLFMDCIDLINKTIKIYLLKSSFDFSYNKKLKHEENFKRHILKLKMVLKFWKMRNLTIEEKINILKTWEISKIVHLAPFKNVLTEIINDLN